MGLLPGLPPTMNSLAERAVTALEQLAEATTRLANQGETPPMEDPPEPIILPEVDQ